MLQRALTVGGGGGGGTILFNDTVSVTKNVWFDTGIAPSNGDTSISFTQNTFVTFGIYYVSGGTLTTIANSSVNCRIGTNGTIEITNTYNTAQMKVLIVG